MEPVDTSSVGNRAGRGSPVRRSLSSLGAIAMLAAVLAACTPQAPPTSIPSCPTRAELELEPPDPSSFSLPRAVAADGTWVALSRSVGDDVVISVRAAIAASVPQAIGSIPFSETDSREPRVSVAADGARVLFAGNVYAPLAGAPTSTVYRWVRATGTTAAVTPPVAASPPSGTPYPVNLRALSKDGERALWSQAFFQADVGFGFKYVRTITDTETDAIVSQRVVDSIPSSTFSSGGRTETLTTVYTGNDYAVIDLDTFAVTSLTPALAAAQSGYPGGAFRPVISSDSGRWTVLQRPFEVPATYVLWDHTTQQVSLIEQASGVRIDTVDDAGTVVYSIDTGSAIHSIQRTVDGNSTTVAAAPMLQTWVDEPLTPLTSTDGRTTLYSEPVPVFGNRLVARRCR